LSGDKKCKPSRNLEERVVEEGTPQTRGNTVSGVEILNYLGDLLHCDFLKGSKKLFYELSLYLESIFLKCCLSILLKYKRRLAILKYSLNLM